ncbi:MAG: polysaccharide biosynthesis C-terminal domain-containing protein [Lachnospiraceae bacterium]|nr:polysaccharide biosynthesis C-terminal domain-containing protein [Lachnospiraceae bacterium]
MKNTHSEIIPKLYMKLLPIQIILVIIGGLNSIIDNAFASNLIGPDAMAVTGLFNPVSNFLNAVNILIFGGAQVLCGKYLGKQMVERTKSIFSLDMITIIILSAVLTAGCETIPGIISTALGAKGPFASELSLYIRGFAIGLPFFCLGTQFTAFLQLEHQEKRSYISIVTMFVVNIFFNWLFLAVFKLGMFGLGLSTSIGNICFFFIQALYYFTGKSILKFSPKNILFKDLKDILINGLPGASSQLCIFIRGIVINRIILHFVGEDGLSAFSAIGSFGCVYWAVPAGVTSAVIVLGSVYVGEEDRAGLIVLMKTFLTRGVGIVSIVSLVLAALCIPFTNFFFHDPSAPVYHMTMMGFLLFPLSSPLSAFVVGFSNYYHCQYHEAVVRVVSVMDGLIGVCLFSLILVPKMGMTGLWLAQIFGGVLTALILYSFAVIYNKKLPLSLDTMMCFPENFGVPDENRIDISVHSMEEVINISRKVWDFCDSHNIGKKQKNCAALCVEELAGNIVRHGFSGKKNRRLDIRVSYIGGDIIISLKDDCVAFNPTEAAKLFDPEDITHNIGLRIAMNISKSMSYQNTFGLNILKIII